MRWSNADIQFLIEQANLGIKRDNIRIPGKSQNAIKVMFGKLVKQGRILGQDWSAADKQTLRTLVFEKRMSALQISKGNYLEVARSPKAIDAYMRRHGLYEELKASGVVSREEFMRQAGRFSRQVNAPPIRTCMGCGGAWYQHQIFYACWQRRLRNGRREMIYSRYCKLCPQRPKGHNA